MPYDLFISYSRRDDKQGRITQLVERIKAAFAAFEGNNGRELVPFFDQHDINGMQDWKHRIFQGLRESRLLLACLSPSYLKSDYCEWEFVEYLKHEIGHLHGFNGVAPIYFVEVPGWDGKEFEQDCAEWVTELRKRQRFDLRPWHDQGEAALREDAVQERMGKLNAQIVQTIRRGELAEQSLGNVDAHNPHFIGRTANLRMLRDNFVKPGHIGVVTAVNGVGGLGKTALAVEYAHAFADEYGGGRWQVRCAGKDDLRLALAELATPIGFEFADDEKKNADLQFERVRRELKKLADARAPHRCLLLLDNVERADMSKPGLLDPAVIAKLNAGDWLHVLATTRLGENELHGAHRDRSFLAIDELPPDDALALIESYQPGGRFRSETERDAAREIVRLLGSFTLAVESAAVYLGQFANDVTCAAFLARLKKEGLEGLDTAARQSDVSVRHGEKRLSATLQPTLERLGAAEKLALEFAALLPPDQVPLPWLRALVAKTFPEMDRDAEPGYPDPWKNVVRRLFSLRLIQAADVLDADGQPSVVHVHRLVQQLMLRHCRATERDGRQQSVDNLIRERDAVLENASNWVEGRWELEILDAVATLWGESRHPSATWLLNKIGMWWNNLAEWSRAERLMNRALAILQVTLGRGHPDVAKQLIDLAQLAFTKYELEPAERLILEALAIAEQHADPKNLNVARCLVVLAEIRFYRSFSDFLSGSGFQEELGFLERALAICDAQLEGSDVAVSLLVREIVNLLSAHLGTSDADSALNEALTKCEGLLKRALVIHECRFGLEHVELVSDLNNLANVFQTTHREADAESMFRRSLNILENHLHPNHRRIAVQIGFLVELLLHTGCSADVELLMRRALMIDQHHFGSNHPNVLQDLGNLAVLLQGTNRLEAAADIRRRMVAITEKCFGPQHLRFGFALEELADVLIMMGNLLEAEPLLRRSLGILELLMGRKSPGVALNSYRLATLLQNTARLEEAEPLMRVAIEISLQFTTAVQEDDQEVRVMIKSYASLLGQMGFQPSQVRIRLTAILARFGSSLDE